jgi:hypothetical protein
METPGFLHKSENGESLKSIADWPFGPWSLDFPGTIQGANRPPWRRALKRQTRRIRNRRQKYIYIGPAIAQLCAGAHYLGEREIVSLPNKYPIPFKSNALKGHSPQHVKEAPHQNGLRTRIHCGPTSHRQNDAELCLAAHHSRVSLGRFFERICFNHRTDAG